MRILLKCRDRYGSVSFPAESLDGIPIPERHYAIANNTLILTGQSDLVLHRDCDTLLRMPDGLYRMPTPLEQDDYVLSQHAAMSIQEAAPVVSDTVSGEEGASPDMPPALLDKIKKVIGG